MRIFCTFFGFLVCCCCLAGAAAADYDVLCDLFNTVPVENRTELLNWCINGIPPCEQQQQNPSWGGVGCNKEGHVDQLDLYAKHLPGYLPDSIGQMIALTYLDLGGNKFRGTLSSSLGLLTNLERLYVGSNNFEGKIPTTLGNLGALSYLGIESNYLTGTLPIQLWRLTNIQYLNAAFNRLGGNLPSIGMESLAKISYLRLDSNFFKGKLPLQLGALGSSLKFLRLDSNRFTGAIPSAIGQLTNLQWLYLSNCKLTGSLPSSLGNLKSLTYFNLYYNRLSGNLPSSIGQLSKLQFLRLYHNAFKGPVPASWCGLSASIDLEIQVNPGLTCLPSCLKAFEHLKKDVSLKSLCSEKSSSTPTIAQVPAPVMEKSWRCPDSKWTKLSLGKCVGPRGVKVCPKGWIKENAATISKGVTCSAGTTATRTKAPPTHTPTKSRSTPDQLSYGSAYDDHENNV